MKRSNFTALYFVNTLGMTTNAFSIVIGLNPALQKRFILSDKTPSLIPGDVHRAASIQEGIGGKGQDVAVTLACLSSKTNGHHLNIHLAQLVGSGAEGDLALSKLNQALTWNHHCNEKTSSKKLAEKQREAEESHLWKSLTVRTEARLRICTTIVANDSATELVEPSGLILKDEIMILKDKVEAISSSDINVKGMCVMGSMPPGCEPNLYADLYKGVKEKHPNMLTVIDTVVGLEHLFKEIESLNRKTPSGGKSMLKINFAELCRLATVKSSNLSSETSSATMEQIQVALSGFFDTFSDARGALDFIAITNGSHPAHLVSLQHPDEFSIFAVNVPDLSRFQNDGPSKIYPIGAGDSVAGGTLAAWEYLHMADTDNDGDEVRLDSSIRNALKKKRIGLRDEDIAATSFAFGISCGSASCIQEENSVLTIRDALELFNAIEVTLLH